MFRIGEFSRIAQVSGRLLRYYDEIGLLSPEFIDPQTGYRYYSAKQLLRLNRILTLKELGLSLEQVARLLEQDISNDEIRGMLTLRKAQIEQTVQQELIRFREIESRLKQLDTHGDIQTPDVVLKTIPAQTILSIREVLPGMAEVRQLVEMMLRVVPQVIGRHNLGYIAVVVHSSIFEPEALDFEVGYLIEGKTPQSVTLSEGRVLVCRELPAVTTMATVVHVGRVESRHHGYGVLGNWMETGRYQIAGPGREILVQLPLPGQDDDAVIEIQLPVNGLE